MKFQVYAGSLGVACEAYIFALAKRHEEMKERRILAAMEPVPRPSKWEDKSAGWWLWRRAWSVETPQEPILRSRDQAEKYIASCFHWQEPEKAIRLRAIAKHKASNILLEVTDEEIGDIALYLPDEGKVGRI